MKKIINGKMYNTETAKYCGGYEFSNCGDFNYVCEELYQKKTGELFLYGEGGAMNWNEVEGAIGHAKIGVKTYTDKNGNERTVNIVERYFDWDPDRLPFG